MEPRSYKTRSRRMQTRWDVRALDVGSQWLITVGGIGTIVAVLFVFLFLFGRTLPLLLPASASGAGPLASALPAETPLHVGIDEYQHLGWALYRDGTLHVLRLDTGEKIATQKIGDGEKITAASFPADGAVALGYGDGGVRLGRISVVSRLRDENDLPPEIQQLPESESRVFEDGLITALADHQFRQQRLQVDLQPPVATGPAGITLLDFAVLASSESESSTALATLDDQGHAQLHILSAKKFLGKLKTSAESYTLPLPPGAPQPPQFLAVGNLGKNVVAAWPNGRALRFQTGDPEKLKLAEEFSLAQDDTPITSLIYIVGRETLFCGDAAGRTSGWFAVRRPNAGTADGWQMECVHRLPPGTAAVTSLAASPQSRLTLAGYADGTLRVFYMTTAHEVLSLDTEASERVAQVLIPGKEKGLWAVTGNKLWHCDFEKRHPEVTLSTLFLPVWYEGYEGPKSVWQSSFAGSEPEVKLGVMPLVFGTLKATFYALLFGAPLAYLAAIYTSEFVHSKYKVQLKSAIELMASLPSVVLGFLAAIVFAPLVEGQVASILAGFFTLPLALMVGAQLWQLLPQRLGLVLRRYRLVFVAVALVLGVLLARVMGPIMERWLFAGDIKAWLDHQRGAGTGGWLLLLLPISALGVLVFATSVLNPFLRGLSGAWGRGEVALVDFAKVMLCVLLTLIVAFVAAWLLNAVGFDPRGALVSTYVQRNALVVGFVMGFAIIPIIYTLAEDALTTVPRHLRSASLGAGATPWQTAVRIVIPTAMSGLFSALMVGLGRAVGETMIVLMAGGNTPIFDMNLFNGFRTLAANIAVELPEAVQNSTHERTLYLSALVLFSFTFVINTVAEMVRQRFRKRAYQL